MNYIDLRLMEKMCHPLAVAIFNQDLEPIALFSEHDNDLLDSALHNPARQFNGVDLYPTFEAKAAILYYSLIKNHPFKNGNKRLATAALLVFLFLNDRWISTNDKVVQDYLVNLAKGVAATEGSAGKDAILAELQVWLDKNIITTV